MKHLRLWLARNEGKEEGTYIKFSYKDLECLINEEGNNFGKV